MRAKRFVTSWRYYDINLAPVLCLRLMQLYFISFLRLVSSSEFNLAVPKEIKRYILICRNQFKDEIFLAKEGLKGNSLSELWTIRGNPLVRKIFIASGWSWMSCTKSFLNYPGVYSTTLAVLFIHCIMSLSRVYISDEMDNWLIVAWLMPQEEDRLIFRVIAEEFSCWEIFFSFVDFHSFAKEASYALIVWVYYLRKYLRSWKFDKFDIQFNFLNWIMICTFLDFFYCCSLFKQAAINECTKFLGLPTQKYWHFSLIYNASAINYNLNAIFAKVQCIC